MAELFAAITKGDRAAVERILDGDATLLEARDESGISPLLAALYRGQSDVADAILRRRPTLDVFEASAAGDAARVRALVDADPALASATSRDGFSPLGLAAFFKRRDVVRYLVSKGADVRSASRFGGFTPLHSAVATDAGACDVEIVRMLLDAGADPNAKAASGSTPLHTVAFTGDRASLELLMRKGADAAIRNADGKTPADVARERGNAAMIGLLG